MKKKNLAISLVLSLTATAALAAQDGPSRTGNQIPSKPAAPAETIDSECLGEVQQAFAEAEGVEKDKIVLTVDKLKVKRKEGDEEGRHWNVQYNATVHDDTRSAKVALSNSRGGCNLIDIKFNK